MGWYKKTTQFEREHFGLTPEEWEEHEREYNAWSDELEQMCEESENG